MRASAFSWKGQEFEGSDESLHLQLERARVGSYIRIETNGVLCEFIENLIHSAHHCGRGVAGGDQARVCDCVHLALPLVQVYPQVKWPSHPLS